MITERQFAPNRFQHCSTISAGPPGSGTFFAYYTGFAEMHHTQHVRIHWFSEDGREATPVDLPDYTGNPILFETQEGTRIIYSKFQKFPKNRVEWWQYCSTWNSSLTINWKPSGPEIIVGAPERITIDEGINPAPPQGLGYLARCNPIWYDSGYMLPLYRENAPHFHGTVLWSKNGIDWEYRGTIGQGIRCIQPTIFDNGDGKLCALLRNFNRVEGQKTLFSQSVDGGKTWSDPIDSPYYNANNSILAVKCKRQNLIIWSNDPRGRNDISLSTFDMKDPILIAKLDSYGSYPSACVSGNTLHIAYTAKPNPLKTPDVKSVVKWKQYDLGAVLTSANRKNIIWQKPQNFSPPSSASSSWRAVPPRNSQNPGNPSTD